MDEFAFDDGGRTTSVWASRLGTLALVALAIVVFEVSANPSLGVAVACLKFGWHDASDGNWLRRVDPRRGRGLACFLIYLGVGFLRASLIAFLGGVAMAILAGQFGAAWGWPDRLLKAQLIGAFGVGFIGTGLSSMFTFAAVVLALVRKVKIWVGPEVRFARQQGVWPPSHNARGTHGTNRAHGAVMIPEAGFILFVIVFGISMLAFLIKLVDPIGPGAQKAVAMIVIILITVGGAALALGFRDLAKNRVLAETPSECWPEIHRLRIPIPIASVDDLA